MNLLEPTEWLGGPGSRVMETCDWPARPHGACGMEFLLQVVTFAPGASFSLADDIDGACLFDLHTDGTEDEPPRLEMPGSPPALEWLRETLAGKQPEMKKFHVACWHDDLIGLHERGFVTYIQRPEEKPLTPWYPETGNPTHPHVVENKGKVVGFLARPDKESGDPGPTPWAVCPTGWIAITEAARAHVEKTIDGEMLDWSVLVSDKVAKLLDLGYLDTCAREACIQLENEVRAMMPRHDHQFQLLMERLQSHSFQDQPPPPDPHLADPTSRWISRLKSLARHSDRTLNAELNTLFMQVRAPHLLRLERLDRAAVLAILTRVARMRAFLELTDPDISDR